ncbi:hypothetical protein [Nannocystis pusilla]|uniref:hypothetical protein n=1 Tax=Nannocystis pusilla TaxID=889268 RepID=UPI003B7C60F9
MARLQQAAWAGNVRELRNYLERCAVLRTIGPLAEQAGPVADDLVIDASQPYAAERQRIIAEFERGYFERLLRLHGEGGARGEAAGVDRTYIYRLLRRHGIEQP